MNWDSDVKGKCKSKFLSIMGFGKGNKISSHFVYLSKLDWKGKGMGFSLYFVSEKGKGRDWKFFFKFLL